MMCHYFLTIGNQREEIPSTDIVNWDEMNYAISRSAYSGVIRTFSSKFHFCSYTARRISEEYLRNKLYASAIIEVQTVNDRWEYRTICSFPLDFSTYDGEDGTVYINSIDNSLSSIIKSSKGNKYDFRMSEISARENTDGMKKSFRYDGVEMDNMLSFRIGKPDEKTNIVSFNTLEGQRYQKLPVDFMESDIIQGKSISGTNQPQEGFKVLTVEELSQMGGGVMVLDRGFPYGSMTNGDYKIIKHSYSEGGLYTKVRVRVYMDIDFIFPAELRKFELWVCTCNPTGRVLNYTNSNDYALMEQVKRNPENGRYQINKSFDLYSDWNIMLLAEIETDSGSSVKIEINEYTFFATWAGHYPSSKIDYIRPITLLNSLMEKMVDGRMNYECSIDTGANTIASSFRELGTWDYEGRLANVIIVPKDAISKNPDKQCFIRTSFDDFCKWMETVFGYVYVVEENRITFCHRTRVFRDIDENVQPVLIENAVEGQYSVDKKNIISSLEIGYNVKEDEAFNMRYEINRKMEYSTGIVNNEKKKSLLSPYRADSIGFELAYEDGINTIAENKNSEDDIWCVLTKEITDGNGERLLIANTDVYVERGGEVKEGMFNYYLSPVYCLKANSKFLSGFVNQYKLTSANINDIGLNVDDDFPLFLKRDFMASSDDCNFFSSPLFEIGKLTFKTCESYILEDLSYPVKVKIGDFLYIGYVEEVQKNFGREEAEEYTLLVKEILPLWNVM